MPGSWNSSDLHASDRAAAMASYRPLFGWRDVDMAQDAGTMLQVPGYGDHRAATVDPGIHERRASAPPGFADVIGGLLVTGDEPPHWHVVGATVLRTAEDTGTRTALLREPQGAGLTVSRFTPPDGDR
ncbi:VOC family protein [Geodermatophilus sp. SYSU D00684]